MTWAVASFAVVAVAAVGGAVAVVRAKQLHRWLWPYIVGCWRGVPPVTGPVDVIVCVADHFEPEWGAAGLPLQRERVARWMDEYPRLADRHRDADGCPLQWTFFYPAEAYVAEHLDRLAALCRHGYGDVEVHLHHQDDDAASLRRQIEGFTATLAERHGLLRRGADGRIRYGFVHGNWALDNSAHGGAWCGVNDELRVLRETGCYADFTFPSAPSETQPAQINSIYYAADDPARPKSHNRGVPAAVGVPPSGDLLLIEGPLAMDWQERSHGLWPRIENGELSADHPPSPHRADLWVRQHVHVYGRPNWVFVKLHTHGANDRHAAMLFGPAMDETLAHLERRYNDGVHYRLHYVTAWQMHNIVRAAEAGATGSPHAYRGAA